MNCCVRLFAVSIALVASLCAAQAPEPGGEEAAIRIRAHAYVDALRHADGKQIATFWTPNGIYVDSQQQSHHARELAQRMPAVETTDVAADDRSAPRSEISSTLRFITPTVALEQGKTDGAAADAGNTTTVQFLAVWVKSNGLWQLDFLREINQEVPRTPITLEELSWMVGQWEASGSGIEANLVVRWSPSKRYLIQTYSVKQAGQPDSTGTQRIAVNPTDNTIRSWTFGDNGQVVTGRWSREGNAWVVKTAGVMSDGTDINAIQFWVPDGKGHCGFRSVQPRIDGKEMQELTLEFIRNETSP